MSDEAELTVEELDAIARRDGPDWLTHSAWQGLIAMARRSLPAQGKWHRDETIEFLAELVEGASGDPTKEALAALIRRCKSSPQQPEERNDDAESRSMGPTPEQSKEHG